MLFTVDQTPAFPLALGGAGLGSDERTVFFGGPVSEQQAVETVLWSLENGINLLDTSPFYGSSERRMGLALKEYGKRNSFILSTKAGTHPSFKGYTAELFSRSIEASLKTLHTDRLDIVHIHDPGKEELKMAMGKNGGMETLLKLKEQGVIRYIGLGVRDHELHRMFLDSGLADVLLPYLDHNLLRQTAGELLQHAHSKKIPVLMGSPLCMGLLSGRDPRKLSITHFDVGTEVSVAKACALHDWCAARSLDLKAINFQFILQHPGITAILAGATSPQEARENLEAFRHPYPQQVLDELSIHFNLKNKTEVIS